MFSVLKAVVALQEKTSQAKKNILTSNNNQKTSIFGILEDLDMQVQKELVHAHEEEILESLAVWFNFRNRKCIISTISILQNVVCFSYVRRNYQNFVVYN